MTILKQGVTFVLAMARCAYLRVGIKYADASSLHHLVYGVNLDSIQVTFVLSMLQIAAVLDVSFHLAAAGESVHPTLTVALFGLSGGVWAAKKIQSFVHTQPFPPLVKKLLVIVRITYIICISLFLFF